MDGVALIQRMFVGHAVDRRGGDVDDALHAVLARRVQHVDGAAHVDSADLGSSSTTAMRRRHGSPRRGRPSAGAALLIAHVGVMAGRRRRDTPWGRRARYRAASAHARTQPLRQVIAEKAGAAGDCNLHRGISSLRRLIRMPTATQASTGASVRFRLLSHDLRATTAFSPCPLPAQGL